MEWIPYTQFTNIKEIARGGFGIIYQATWLDGSINKLSNVRRRRDHEIVILKRFINSHNINKYFLNELKSNQYCYQINHHIIRTYGFTKDPKLNDYILVMQYAPGGDLHNYLQKNFTEITWNKQKLSILWQISEGLETIHNSGFIHRDFHSGNIFSSLLNGKRYQWQIGDLGLSQPTNNTSPNNEIYGVIPYIAPEIFKGFSFSKESDVYSMGMIMWELTTGCKPFANVEHDIILIFKILDGERPKITEDTPECYTILMKSCWDSDLKKRPSITEIRKTVAKWFFKNKHIEPFIQAENKRKELINLEKLGPEFSEKFHPKAIFTSRLLTSYISKCSSINSSKDYTSIELKLDIDIGRSIVLGTKRTIEESYIDSNENDSNACIKLEKPETRKIFE
ncbi:kinase-like domain-containing protein [Rhizophagus diaphanus]|nr:kinase-like domain-containing protein [Rhizophagus diaphanus] [Rhizophagus sp. MUCL 43196]